MHHPGEELLVDYAAGALARPLMVVVAAHLAFCAECQQITALCDQLGGAVLAALPPAPMRADSRDAALGKLDLPPGRSSLEIDALGSELAMALAGGSDRLRWWKVLPGLAVASLGLEGQAWALRMKAGRRLPRHSHSGLEAICVLSGEFTDNAGRYVAGDFAAYDEDFDHDPVAGGEGCLCLVGLEAPVRLTGPIGRLLNPFLRH